MVQKNAPSLQHYIKGYYTSSEMVCEQRFRFLLNPPWMTYKPLDSVFWDMLNLNQPYQELLRGLSIHEKRPDVFENFKQILALLHEEFGSISPDYVHAIQPVYYSVSKDIRIPFRPLLMYGVDGKKFIPWLSFWKSDPLSGKKLSLFATIVEELLKDNPDLEDACFQIYDMSAPGSKYPRAIRVTDLKDIPKLSDEEKLEMLLVLEKGYALADVKFAEKAAQDQKNKTPEPPDPNQYALWAN